MSRHLALDLFCGAGGASMGLYRAGFDVVGVDIKRQPRYPFRFVQGDALNPPFDLSIFDFIWASPPCQAFSCSSHYMRAKGKTYPNLIEATRALLGSTKAHTVIENVPQAPIRADIVLDGTMFPDLKVVRRRHFETNFRPWLALGFPAVGLIANGWSTVAGGGGRKSGYPLEANKWHTNAAMQKAMGIDWMTNRELSQSIPPEYSEHIARSVLPLASKQPT